MSFPFNTCPLTGSVIRQADIIPHPENLLKYEYKNPLLGSIILNDQSYSVLEQSTDLVQKSIITSICRHHYEKYKTSFEVKHDFAKGGYKEINYPSNFNEKAYFYLKYLYDIGGNEYRSFDIKPFVDYPISYANNINEYIRILTKLENEGLVETSTKTYTVGGHISFLNLSLKTDGIDKVEELFPNIPMLSLISHEIQTGDTGIDDKLNQARKLFFKKDSTFEDKRNACETLSFVLEPLREELKDYFANADVSTFFQLVNNFDIRHNKDYTNNLELPEQLEWVFYTLLNSISCFMKIKRNTIS